MFVPQMRNPLLPHQVVISIDMAGGNKITVSCNCLRRPQGHTPIEGRVRWEPGEAVAAWHAYHETERERSRS